MKRLIVALTALVFSLTAVFINPIYTGAVGVDTAVKLVGGKAVVRAVSEKTGMMLSPKQLDNVVDLIEKKTYDGDAEVIEWVNKANLVKDNPSTTPSSKTGFKKYVLDPMLWLTGADLILEAVNAFQDGYDTNTDVPLYSQCKETFLLESGTAINLTGKDYIYEIGTNGQHTIYVFNNGNYNGTLIEDYEGSYDRYMGTGQASLYIDWPDNTNDPDGYKSHPSVPTIYFPIDVSNTSNHYLSTAERVCNYDVQETDLIDTSKVSPTVINNFDNDTYNTNTTYNLEIEMPDSPDYNDTTPWNEKDLEIENEIVVAPPVVVDPDPDGDEVIGAVLVKGDPIETPSNFFTLIGEMGAKVHDTYNGVVKFVGDSVTGMNTLIAGTAGLVAFFTGFFDYLPDPFVTVMSVGFMMGFIMYFFRR